MNRKGQQSMQGLALSVVVLAVSIGIGVVVYDAFYRGAVAETFTSESIGNVSQTNTTQEITDVLDHTPVYFGSSRADGIANATATVVDNSDGSTTLTLVCCTLPDGTANTFNVTTNGLVTLNSTNNGTVRVTYSVLRVSDTAHTSSFTEINDQVYSGWQLAAISIIVMAAVAVLGYLFVLQRSP